MPKINFKIAAVVMICIYTVGAVGHLNKDLLPLFLWLTPFNLVLTLMLYLGLNSLKPKDIIVLLIVFFIGFFVEVLGVKTGLLFGEYSYGKTLGYKSFDVPLVIGLNWVLLNLAGFGVVNKWFKSVYLKSMIASIMIVLLDVLIEPVAISLDYWSWLNDEIPLQNYLMWFLVSFVIQLIINKSKIKIDFKSSLLMFVLQLLFFVILNVAL